MKAALLKAGLLGIVSLALIAASDPPQDAPEAFEPPPFFAERIEDGRVELGQFEYLRGYFPEASEEEKAQYADLIAWLDACESLGRERLDKELASLGVAAGEGLPTLAGASNVCQQVVTGESFKEFESYAQIADASRGARLVFDTLVQSTLQAKRRAQRPEADLGEQLSIRTLDDQMLRHAYRWGWGEVKEMRKPKMTADERTVFLALLTSELLFVDYRNREWLKQVVTKQGWPKVSEVGKRGAFAAWLLTQHADMDPAFQWRALQLMEPLLEENEVGKLNYASLYDRTTLKLDVRQRFGIQLRCKNGAWEPYPIENPDAVDERRAEVGLGTLADHIAGNSQPCPQ